jgi:hypothetical protein
VIEPYAALAGTGAIVLVLAAWGFGEAIVVPVVPDVLIGILVLAAPWTLPHLLAATIAGAIAGSIVAWWLLLRRRSLAEALLARQPGLGAPGLAEAEGRLRARGLIAGFAQLGPGLPLKAYLHALAVVAPASGARRVALLALVNRIARLGPVALGFALLHPLAVGIDGDPAILGLAYVAGWALFYAAYWWRRDPRRYRLPPGS